MALAAIWIIKEFKEVPHLRDPQTAPYLAFAKLALHKEACRELKQIWCGQVASGWIAP